MKIIFTIADYGAAAHVGADVERTSYSVEIPDEQIPKRVLDALEWKKQGKPDWCTVSLSMEEKE